MNNKRLLLGLAVLAVFVATGTLALAQEPGAPVKGDQATGKNLFTGAARLENGGPPCMACHSVAGLSALGGGTVGPDLTDTYGKMGDAWAVFPESVPPMQAIYSSRVLTAAEKAHLSTFLGAAAVSQRPAGSAAGLIGLAVGGAVVFSGLTHLLWRRRLGGVRRPLVARGGPNP